MRLAIEHPASLLPRETGGQLTQERQKPLLILFHTQDQSQPALKANRTRKFLVAMRKRDDLGSERPMDDLIKLVRTYRLTAGLAERIRLAEEIFRLIEPDLRLFVFSSITHDAAKDALQEVLKAVATSLKKFEGGTVKEFWAWCYRIARNKLSDHYRSKAADRTQSLPPEELWRMMELSAQDAPLTAQTRLDLDYAIKLLTATKPECSDLLWRHYVIGLDYTELAEERNVSYDNVRMKIGRCLDEAKSLIS
jgi:RNA polymerase sigma factor (sigma-70 family)